jgi:ribosomal protein L16 Arg81 hydroxylase
MVRDRGIKKIKAPSRREFLEKYMSRKKPVVIRGLFDDSPISRIRSLGALTAALPNMKVDVHESYSSLFTRERRLRVKNVKSGGTILKKYGERVLHRRSDQEILYAECSTPKPLLGYFKVPPYARMRFEDPTITSSLYISEKGSATSLHVDKDCRHVFLYQVFGSKRVIIVSPDQGKKIWPYLKLSGLSMHDLTDEEMEELLDYTDGHCVTLAPGETLYLPPLVWHAVQYLDVAMSVSFRFGRTKLGKYLADITECHDMYWQTVSYYLYDRDPDDPVTKKYLARIRECERKKYADKFSKYKAMHDTYKGIYAELCTKSIKGIDNYNIVQWIAESDLKHEVRRGFYYRSVGLGV